MCYQKEEEDKLNASGGRRKAIKCFKEEDEDEEIKSFQKTDR